MDYMEEIDVNISILMWKFIVVVKLMRNWGGKTYFIDLHFSSTEALFVCNRKSVIFPFSPDSNRECREEQQEGEKKEGKKKWEGAKKIPKKKPGKKEEM